MVSLVNKAEELTVALPYTGNPPYSFGVSKHPQGIYVDMLNEIFALTPYTLKYVYLPNARIRAAFKAGEIDIECCPIPSWRKEEQNISIYTHDFFNTTDLYISKAKLNTKEVTKSPIGTVRGYGYRQQEFLARFDVENELEILQLIQNKRIQAGIVDQQVANFLIKQHNFDLVDSGVHENISRRLRIHKSKKHTLNKINKAIYALKQTNTFTQILNKYLTAPLPKEND